MAAEATQPPSGSSASTAYPRWVLLDRYSGERNTVGSHCAAAARTLATAFTSTGHSIGVSLSLAAPPATSSICIYFPHNVDKVCSYIVAAHGDSVLIYISFEENFLHKTVDYLVYNAGATSAEPARPPTLSLLPQDYLTKQEMEEIHSWDKSPLQRHLITNGTGLLRRGDEEFVVAELRIIAPEQNQLTLLCSGHWNVQRPVVIQHDSQHGHETHELLSSWTTHTILPLGDAQLCWVDLHRGLLFCSVFDEIPVLWHVPLPVEAGKMEPLSGTRSFRNVCVTSGGDTVKFVGVFPRCCCGGVGSTHCQRSKHAYTINNWTLRMDGMVWVMDGMVDATELWGLNAYEGLPRVPLVHPIVSLDDPHSICFTVCEWFFVKDGGDETVWMISVDMRTKALLSVSRYSKDYRFGEFLPSRISYYLNSNTSRSSNCASSSRECNMSVTQPTSSIVVIDDLQTNDTGNNTAPSSSLSSPKPSLMQLSVVLAAFEEIQSYGLDRDDMLKAYSILCQDDGRRFRSLLGLPNNLRKDWLLMEVKATQA